MNDSIRFAVLGVFAAVGATLGVAVAWQTSQHEPAPDDPAPAQTVTTECIHRESTAEVPDDIAGPTALPRHAAGWEASDVADLEVDSNGAPNGELAADYSDPFADGATDANGAWVAPSSWEEPVTDPPPVTELDDETPTRLAREDVTADAATDTPVHPTETDEDCPSPAEFVSQFVDAAHEAPPCIGCGETLSEPIAALNENTATEADTAAEGASGDAFDAVASPSVASPSVASLPGRLSYAEPSSDEPSSDEPSSDEPSRHEPGNSVEETPTYVVRNPRTSQVIASIRLGGEVCSPVPWTQLARDGQPEALQEAIQSVSYQQPITDAPELPTGSAAATATAGSTAVRRLQPVAATADELIVNAGGTVFDEAAALIDAGQTDIALGLLQAASRDYGSHAMWHELVGEAHLRRDEFRPAIAALSAALKINKQSARANFLMGFALMQIGQENRGEHYLLQAHHLDGRFPLKLTAER